MDIFDLSLLERATSIQVEQDEIELVVNDVKIVYRKYLDGFEPVMDVELDGASYYRKSPPNSPEELAAAKRFFVRAADEGYDRRRAVRSSAAAKLKKVFGDPVNC